MFTRMILFTALSVTTLANDALQAQEAGKLEVRVYPVADIVRTVPDYPFQPGLPASNESRNPGSSAPSGAPVGGGYGVGGATGGGFFQITNGGGAVAQGAASQSPDDLDTLVDVIQTSIAPDTWTTFGGNASIVALGTNLIVRQTAEVHEEIQTLLKSLSQLSDHQTMVKIQAFLVSPKSAQDVQNWKKLVTFLRENPLDPSQALSELEPNAKDLGEITCFSGQRVHLAAGKCRNVVSSAVPVVSAHSAAYQPWITTLHIGTLLEFTATVAPGGRSAMLDVRCAITDWNDAGEPIKFSSEFGPGQTPAPGAGGGGIGGFGGGGFGGSRGSTGQGDGGGEISGGRAEAAVDRVNLDAKQLATTVRVPISAEEDSLYPVVVGTLGNSSAAGEEPDGTTGLSYLVVIVSQIDR